VCYVSRQTIAVVDKTLFAVLHISLLSGLCLMLVMTVKHLAEE